MSTPTPEMIEAGAASMRAIYPPIDAEDAATIHADVRVVLEAAEAVRPPCSVCQEDTP